MVKNGQVDKYLIKVQELYSKLSKVLMHFYQSDRFPNKKMKSKI